MKRRAGGVFSQARVPAYHCFSQARCLRTIALPIVMLAALFVCTGNTAFAQPGCSSVQSPFVESFDTYGYGINVLPTCWVRKTNFDDNNNKPQISNSSYFSSPSSLRMYCGANNTGGHYAIVFTPEIEGDITSLYVRLKIRGYSGSKIEVGIASDTTNDSFTPIDTLSISSTNSWKEHLVSLASYTGNGSRLAIRMMRSLQNSNGLQVFIDDMNVEPCGVWNQQSLQRSRNDLWLSWDTIGNPTVDLEYGPEGFIAGTGTSLSNVYSPLNIVGLSPNSSYEFRFLATCVGGSPRPAGSLTASTLGGDTLTLNYCEGFEDNGNSLPAGWRSAGNVVVSTSSAYGGSRALRFYGRNELAVLPPVGDESAGSQLPTNLTVSFQMRSYYTGAMMIVGVMDYPEYTSDFTPVDTVWSSTEWNRYSVDLSGYTGSGQYVALLSSDPNNYYVYLDNLQVGSCMVDNVSRLNITSHSVELQWDTVNAAFHSDSVVVEYGLAGFASGSGNRIVLPVRGNGVQTSGGRQRIVIDNLLSDSVYQFLVYGECAGMTSHCDLERINVHTLAQDILLPYCVDFEQYDNHGYPTDWTRPSVYSQCPQLTNDRAHSGQMSLQMYAYGSSMSSHSVAALPLIEVDSVQGLQVSFWGYGDCYYGSTVEVGVMLNPDDEGTFAPVDTFQLVNNEWRQYASDLSSYSDTGRYIAFRFFTGNYNYYGYIDDIEVSTCAVKNVRSYSATSHGVTIGWESGGEAYNGAVVEFGPHGFTPGSGTTVTVDANTMNITLDTLQAGSQYDYRVSSLCSGQTGHCDLFARSFTTLAEQFVATWCEDFNSCNCYELPSGWTAPLRNSSYPYVCSDYLQFYSSNYGQQTSMVVLPFLEESDLSGLSLRFKGIVYNNKSLVVGMMTNPLDTTTFVPIDSLTSSSDWRDYTVDLSAYSGSGRHIAIWCKNDGLSSYAYVDNMVIERCRLSDVFTYSPTTTSVMVSWNATASTDQVTLQYRRSDYPEDSTVTVDNVTSPYKIEGLETDKSYTFGLTPHCSGSSRSCNVDRYAFTTLSEDLADGWCGDDSYNRNYYVSPSDSVVDVLPYVSDNLSSLVLSMDLSSSSNSNPEQSQLIVGVATLPFDLTTFTPVDTLHPGFQKRTVAVDFSSYAGNGHHIVLIYKDNNYRTTGVERLALSRCKVVNPVASQITNRSMHLIWDVVTAGSTTPSGTANSIVSYFPIDEPENVVVVESASPVTVGGLAAGTTYRFLLWAACQDSSMLCQSTVLEAATLAEPMTIPYCYGFENDEDHAIPAGWSRPYGKDYPHVVINQNPHSGSRSLELYSEHSWNGTQTTSMAVMPMLDPDSVDDVSSLFVDFWMHCGIYQRLVVGVMTDPNDTSTFVAVDTVVSNGMRHVKVSLAAYSGSGRHIAFRVYSLFNSSGYVWVDDVNLRRCVVTSSVARHPMQTSVDIVWSAPTTTNGVVIEYKEVGLFGGNFAEGSGTEVTATTSPFTIEGLTPATYYAFHVYPDCGDGSDGCNYEYSSIQTLHPSVDIPYCDNFDGYSAGDYPDNWRRLSTYDSASNPIITNNQSHSANNSTYFTANDTLYSLLVLPKLDMGTSCAVADTIYASFWTYFGSNSTNSRLVAGKMTDIYDASTFVAVDTLTASEGNVWESQIAAFPSFNTATEYMAFRFESASGSWSQCYMDDICLEKCMATEVTISDITQNSVTITWNSHSVDSMVCEYGPHGFIAGEGTQIVIHNSPYVVDGLVDGTDYQFVFAAVCGCEQYGEALTPSAGSSGWTYWGGYGWGWGYGSGNGWGWGFWGGRHWWETPGGGGTVAPMVVPVATQAANITVPYCESFETYDTLPFPNSWRKVSGSSSQFPRVGTDNHRTGSYCLDFYTAPSTTCLAALPPCDSGAVTDMVMTLNAYTSSSHAVGQSVFVVGVMDDPDQLTTFTPVDTLTLTATATWQSFVVDFAAYGGTGRYIAMRFAPSGQAGHIYVDDLYLGHCAVSNVRLTTTAMNTLVQWTSHHQPDSVIVEYGPVGFLETGIGIRHMSAPAGGVSGSIALTSIIPGDSYDVYVYADCGDTGTICTLNHFTLNRRLTLPYCEDFEGYPYGGYPDDWRTWHSSSSTSPVVDTFADNSLHALRLETGTGTNNTIVALTQFADGDSLSGKRVNLMMRSSSTYARLQLGLLTDTNDLMSFVPLATIANSSANVTQEFSIQLASTLSGVNSLAVKASTTSGNSIVWIDRIIVSNSQYPVGVSDSERGYATRVLTWDSAANYTLEYSDGSTLHTVVSDNCSITLAGLSAGRKYEVYFVSPSGERFCHPYCFTTTTPVSLPYCDDFDSYSRYNCPEGWRQLNDGSGNCTSDGTRPRIWDAGISGSSCLDFYSPCTQIFVMPEFDIDSVRNIGLTFWAYCQNVSDMMVLGIIENPDDASTFIGVDTVRFSSTYNWEYKTVNLTAYNGGARYVAFKSIIGSTRPVYIDNLAVSGCPIPAVSISSASSVDVTAPDGAYNTYYIEYGLHGFAQGSGTIVAIDPASPFTIDGLQPAATYDFYLRSDSDVSACFLLDSVTLPGLVTLPYCDDWSSQPAYTLPAGWRRYSTYDASYPRLTSYSELQFYSNRDHVCAAIMPDIDIDSLSRMQVYFDLYSEDFGNEAMIVGVCDDPDDISTFVAVDTVRNTASYDWQNGFRVSLDSYQGSGRFLTFMEYNAPASSYSRSVYIRNLRIQGCPHGEVYLYDATTVAVSLPEGAGGTMFVEYDTVGFAQGSGTVVAVSDTLTTISGLQSNSRYDFYLRCDSLVPTCQPPTTVATLTSLPLPYCEDFENHTNYAMPTNWLAYENYSSNSQYVYEYSYSAYRGYKSLYVDFNGNNASWVVLPSFNMGEDSGQSGTGSGTAASDNPLRELNLYFYLRMNTPESSWLIVGVMDNPYDVGTFTPVDTISTATSNTYYRQHVSFADYAGDGRFIALCGTSPNSSSWRAFYIDDLTVQTCPLADFTLADATTVAVTLPEGSGDAVYAEYGPSGFTQGSGTIVRIGTQPFSIGGLQENSSYDFYSRCDSLTPSCVQPVTITTSSSVDLPYCENFDYSGTNYQMPAGWRRYNTSSTSSSTSPYVNSNSELYMYAYYYDVCYSVLPVVDTVAVNSLTLSFDLRVSSSSNSGLIAGVMDNPDDIATFVAVDTLFNTDESYRRHQVSLAGYQGTGRFIALRHLSTSSSKSVYVDNLTVESCYLPAGIRATLYSSNTVRITADSLSQLAAGVADPFYIEYDTTGFTPGNGNRLLCTSLPLDLTLANYAAYDFYFLCDTLQSTCRVVQTVITSGDPFELSYCEDFESTPSNQLPTGWHALSSDNSTLGNSVRVTTGSAHTTNSKLQMATNNYRYFFAVLPEMAVDSLSQLAISFYMRSTYNSSVTVGVLSDPNDPSTFLPVNTFTGGSDWTRYILALEGVHHDARYLAFRSNPGTSSGTVYIDDVFIDSCGVHGFIVGQTESDHITLTWNRVGNPDITIEYGPYGFQRGSGTIIHPTASPYTVVNLDALTSYMFYFDAVCDPADNGYCNLNYHDSVSRFTPAGGTGCIDPTNLTADYTTCFYGSFGNPTQHIGIVDYGASDIRSRHTVHYDTTATDPRTGNLLRQVPEGAEASVRLGNWNYGGQNAAEAESIVYSLFVDTTAFDLLILKYAAVLQDPDHAVEDQPRFSLQLLDDSLRVLDSVCASANFIANRNLGWNQAPGDVLWKDWTTVGVDVKAYGGQTVNIRLTTYDCNEGNHYGYAYFTLGCMLKNMRSELCGDVDSNRFYAPSGFAYRWYNESDTSLTLSTEQSIGVPTDNSTYYCDCSFVDNSDCRFTLSAFAGTRYPLADFTYSVEQRDCRYYVTFTNTSTISLDGSDTLVTGEPCETALWDFGNGETSDSYNASTVYNRAGSYTVTLTSGIASDSCTHQKQIVLKLLRDSSDIVITGPDAICHGDSITLTVTGLSDSIHYETLQWFSSQPQLDTVLAAFGNDTTVTIDKTLIANQASTVTIHNMLVNTDGCTDTFSHAVVVYPEYALRDTVAVCDNHLPYTWNDTTVTDSLVANHGSQFDLRYSQLSIHGCDSVNWLTLMVHPTYLNPDTLVLCQSQLPYTWHDTTIENSQSVIDNSPFTLLDSLTTVNGCDSVHTMLLTIHPTTYGSAYDTIVENQLPYTYLESTFTDSLITSHQSQFINHQSQFTILNSIGCDSVVDYYLTIYLNDTTYIDSSICASQLPFTWKDTIVTDSQVTAYPSLVTLQDSLATTNGADSVVILSLTVHPEYLISDTAVIVQNQLPYTWHGNTVDNSQVADTYSTITLYDSLITVNGCDSVLQHTLIVYLNDSVAVSDTMCASVLPYVWNGVTFSVLDSVRHYADGSMSISHETTLQTADGADSVVQMVLYLIPTTYGTVYDTIVENQLPYTWYYGTDSVSFDSLPNHSDTHIDFSEQLTTVNFAGCDSVIDYHLTVWLSDTVEVDSAVCASGLPFEWNGMQVALSTGEDGSQTGMLAADTVLSLRYVTQNSHGADSVVDFSVTVHPLYDLRDTLVTCDNQLPYSWRDSAISVPMSMAVSDTTVDVQIDTLSSYGCDSVMQLHLTVGRSYAYYDTMTMCGDQLPYSWRDTTVTESSENNAQVVNYSLQSPLQTVLGCDSVYHLDLTVNPVHHIVDNESLCQTQLPYTWHDTTVAVMTEVMTQDSSFMFDYSTVNAYGCDSTHTLQLVVHPTTYSTVYDTIVENQLPYTYLDTVFYAPDTVGVKSITLNSQRSILNSHGCDSIVDYWLTIYLNDTTNLMRTVCADALPYSWNGITFDTAAQTSTVTLDRSLLLSTAHGADSLVRMTLTVNPVFLFHDTAEFCTDQLPYTWCDTTFDMFMGTIASSGYFTRHFNTSRFCDSTRTLLLLVHGVYYTTDHQESCGDFEWIDGVVYTTDTVGPYVILESRYGCDSTVTLDFHISQPARTSLTDSFCVTDIYTWHGYTITASQFNFGNPQLFYDTLSTVEGCDSIVTLTLTMLQQPQVSIDVESDCRLHIYGLTAHSNVGYVEWSCSATSWRPDWGPATSSQVWVAPPMIGSVFTVTADYTADELCPNKASIVLDPMRVPQARMKVSPEHLGSEDDHFYVFDQSLNADTRVWWIDDVFYGSDERIVAYPPQGADSVLVTLIAESGYCVDTAYQIVPIYRSSIYAPNAFTPGESTNKEFIILMDGIVEYELRIYNRAGVLIFHTTDPAEGWNGTLRGVDCPQGSYVWVLRYTTEDKPRQPQTKKGSVLLIR